jgi:hypothetical protein
MSHHEVLPTPAAELGKDFLISSRRVISSLVSPTNVSADEDIHILEVCCRETWDGNYRPDDAHDDALESCSFFEEKVIKNHFDIYVHEWLSCIDKHRQY